MDNKEKQFSLSWFFRWFLDNKAITVFLVTLLLGLNLLVLSKITFIFIPIFEFAGAVMLSHRKHYPRSGLPDINI